LEGSFQGMEIGGIRYRRRRPPIDGSIGSGAHDADTHVRHLLDEDDGSHAESAPMTLGGYPGECSPGFHISSVADDARHG
jgi:hypothetical protein